MESLNITVDAGTVGDFMQSVEESIIEMMKESVLAPQNAIEQWGAFSAAIDWSETWIRGLLTFHVVLFITTVLTRNHVNFQTVLFLFNGILVVMSERINSYCDQHWLEFSKQNYFDKHGVFAGIMFAGPLLLICFFQLVRKSDNRLFC